MGLAELKATEGTIGKKVCIESVCKHTHFNCGERVTLQYYNTGEKNTWRLKVRHSLADYWESMCGQYEGK
jgi:hypothetical protein